MAESFVYERKPPLNTETSWEYSEEGGNVNTEGAQQVTFKNREARFNFGRKHLKSFPGSGIAFFGQMKQR